MIDSATILAESEEHLIKLDMEMSEALIAKLMKYATKHMPAEELIELQVSWAVNELLRELMGKLDDMPRAEQDKYMKQLLENYDEQT